MVLKEDNPEYLGRRRADGPYDRAQEWLERLLKIREGKNDVDLALVLNEVAGLYESQGRYSEAEPLYKRDLEISEKSLGKNHPSVAITLNNLAMLYKAQEKYKEADPLYQRGLSIFKAKLPAGHPHIRIVQENYDDLQRKMAGQKHTALNNRIRRGCSAVKAVKKILHSLSQPLQRKGLIQYRDR